MRTLAQTEDSSLLPDAPTADRKGPVECFGMMFDSDDDRRSYFLARLKAKLPDLRQRPDFPTGEDEDILRLSDPPYHTACPNPFLAEFVEHHGKPYDPDEPYHREPFAVDVSVGKTDPLYKAHGYHTKVPHRAIVPSILHYTEPGDVVLDGFCGSGMTGVAAQWCGTAPRKYRIELEQQWKKEGRQPPKWGARRAILGDLSPAATFIAANYNIPFDVDAFANAAQKLLDDVEEEIGWMYETQHTDGKTKGRINYTVWSECFACPDCAGEIVFYDVAFDKENSRVSKVLSCPHCNAIHTKEQLALHFEVIYDESDSRASKVVRRVPKMINYTVNGRAFEKAPDMNDLAVLDQIQKLRTPSELPTVPLPDCQMARVGRMRTTGTTHVHQMFLPRAAHAMASLWSRANNIEDVSCRKALLYLIEQATWGMSVLNRYGPSHFSQVNRQLTGVYYVSSLTSECSPWYNLSNRIKRLHRTFGRFLRHEQTSIVSTADCGQLDMPGHCIDYIFTDPPFGENIYYADLNYLVESWHRVYTNVDAESIIDRVRGKGTSHYRFLMESCFKEYKRVLKPGHWITTVFHNSRNEIWVAIQEAMLSAGLVVADVRVLDKGQRSFMQVVGSNAVKRDLVISAYRPNDGLEERFRLTAGTAEGVWDFVRTHLGRLPLFVERDGSVEVVSERQDYLLYDRMVAFHVLRGVTVPLSAAEFYEALRQRFAQRDGMCFLPEQVVEYDRKRAKANGVLQLELFVKDEETAIQWLRHQLDRKPQTFQDIHPAYIQELGGWAKHEKMLELSRVLKENFLHYDGTGEVPPQIHTYLSTNFKDLRNLPKDALPLRTKAKARWYVPDPHKAADLEKLRERTLLREFAEYQNADLRRLKVFRLQAIRAGFRRAWQEQDYATIVAVGGKIPSGVIQEDPKLLMWLDQATVRVEELL